MKDLIKICNLNVRFHTYEGIVQALDGLDLSILKGETLGLVGETGSGKTITGLSILRLIGPPGKIESGRIMFSIDDNEPIDLLKCSESEIRAIRGSQIAMVFQEPGAALNPVFSIGDQLIEGIILHRYQELAQNALETIDNRLKDNGGKINYLFRPIRLLKRNIYRSLSQDSSRSGTTTLSRIPIARRILQDLKDEAEKIAISVLREVDIPDADRIIKHYPHELSGGMKQRVVIAMALSCCSRLIIADEPTTSLDVTIQAQINELLKRLKREFHTSLLYITHNLGVAAEICDRVAVMYAGKICEIANVSDIFKKPMHPYTRALMAAMPKVGEEPHAIGGYVPDALLLPSGCRFHPRCQYTKDICTRLYPDLTEITPGHFVACHIIGGK